MHLPRRCNRFAIALVLAVGVVACERAAPSAPPDPSIVAAAQSLVNEEFEKVGPREFGEAWLFLAHGLENGTTCGTFEPGPIGRHYVAERRYIYFPEDDTILIQPVPEATVTLSGSTRAVMTETKTVIERMWQEGCEPFRPS